MALKARFWAYCQSVSGGGATVRLRTANSTDSNWGTTIDGTEADWGSTATNLEDEISVTSTGWKSWNVDTANLALGTGTTWFRLADTAENSMNTKNAIFRSEEYSGTTYDPYLEIYEEADANIQTLALLGVGG